MRNPETIGVNKTQEFGNFRVTTQQEQEKKKAIPGSVALHEAKHAVTAVVNGTGVESATIIAGPGYLGLTKLTRPDAIAAAAPHATGSSGTSHDVAIVEFMGHDVHAASTAARSIVENNHDKVTAVASILEERGSVSGYEIEEAMRIDNTKISVNVIVEDLKNGKVTTEKAMAVNDIVIFQKEWTKPNAEKDDVQLAA